MKHRKDQDLVYTRTESGYTAVIRGRVVTFHHTAGHRVYDNLGPRVGRTKYWYAYDPDGYPVAQGHWTRAGAAEAAAEVFDWRDQRNPRGNPAEVAPSVATLARSFAGRTRQPDETAPTRVFFTCGKCKHVWARDYTRATWRWVDGGSVAGAAVFHYPRHRREDVVFRVVDGAMQTPSMNATCPACGNDGRGRWLVTNEETRGRHAPEVKCGARCRNAKGGDCECSCGGANHGVSRLV